MTKCRRVSDVYNVVRSFRRAFTTKTPTLNASVMVTFVRRFRTLGVNFANVELSSVHVGAF